MFKDTTQNPLQFTITASYSYGAKTANESTPIDLEMFHHSAVNPEPVVAELRAIKETLEKILRQQ